MDIKTLCLGVLTFGDHSGYEIKKHFEHAFNHFFSAGFGSIYPALASLTDDELVECHSVPQDKRPDKKVYHLTESGRAHLIDILKRTYPSHKVRSEFFALLYFAELLSEPDLQRIVQQRSRDISELLDTLARLQPPEKPGHELVLGLARASLQAQLDYLRNHADAVVETDPGHNHPA